MTPNEFFHTVRVYGEPDVADGAKSDVIVDGYIRMLSEYDEETLDLAWNLLQNKRNFRNFPLLPELREYCREAQSEIVARRSAGAEKVKKDDPWSNARVQAANRMMNSDIGRLAAAEGWILLLHDYCRANGHLPDGLAAEKVRRECLAILREQENNAKRWGTNNPIVSRIAHAFEIKRKKLSALAYGREG